MKTILDLYKNVPTNSIRAVNDGFVIKGSNENSIIHIMPNLKREFMMQVSDSFQTGFSFYENSSLAEIHYNDAKVAFNANNYEFLRQFTPQKKSSKPIRKKNKLISKNKFQKHVNIDNNDRFKNILKNLQPRDITTLLSSTYMTSCMLCKEIFDIYKAFLKKDFFTNKPQNEIVKNPVK